MQSAAGILSARDFGVRCVFSERDDEFGFCACGSLYREENCAVGETCVLNGYLQFGFASGTGNCAAQRSRVAADKLLAAIDNHLRRVDTVEREMSGVAALPFRHGVKGEGIAPAEVIPVGNVFAENDGLGVGNELCGIEAGEESVGRGTVRATFRCEEFDENGLARGRCRRLL